jgi:hypothetical protein
MESPLRRIMPFQNHQQAKKREIKVDETEQGRNTLWFLPR